MTNLTDNLGIFESFLLLLLGITATYLLYGAYRDYRQAKIIRQLTENVYALIDGEYSDILDVAADSDLEDLANSLSDLSEVVRLTHGNLSQERDRLSSLLAYMTDGVLATDRGGKIVTINETAQKQLNLTAEQALKMTILDILGSDNPYSYHDLVAKTPNILINRRNEFGEFMTLRFRFTLNRRESGFISGLVVVLHDVTEQEKEERERRLFVSNVSHELRTPLTSVKSYLEALDEGALKDDVAPQFIKVSLDETNRMMRMITDLLNLSRIDNGAVQLEVEMTNFTAFMTSILNRFDKVKSQHTTSDKNFEIVRDYPLTSVWMEIDNDKMTQVIENILNNAIKYSPDGGQIKVSMKTTDSQLIISITDQGLGIPKKDLPLIFDRFYRVDKARSRAQGGTGLGLSIAKEIVKQHQGFIWAKSEEGKGSTFTIVLPYDKEVLELDEWEDYEDNGDGKGV